MESPSTRLLLSQLSYKFLAPSYRAHDGSHDGSQEGELRPVAHAKEVIGVDGLNCWTRQPLVIGELGLQSDRSFIVITEPTVSPLNIIFHLYDIKHDIGTMVYFSQFILFIFL